MGGMSKEVRGEEDDECDEEEYGEQKCSDIAGGAVGGLGRGLGDGEEVDEECGDVAEDGHGYWIE